MKRILSLDGGGIRGVFSLEILLRMEALLRERLNDPKLVLADQFDFFAGTSTGAIIAACLSWGMEVEKILELYVKHGTTMFQPVPWYRPIKRLFVSHYNAKPLSDLLQRIFSEDGDGKVPALLDSKRLRDAVIGRCPKPFDRLGLAYHQQSVREVQPDPPAGLQSESPSLESGEGEHSGARYISIPRR